MTNCNRCEQPTTNAKYCTRVCAILGGAQAYTARAVTRTCVYEPCGAPFTASRPRQVYCSRRCRLKGALDNANFKRAITHGKPKQKTCALAPCGKPFQVGRNWHQKYCSKRCFNQGKRRRQFPDVLRETNCRNPDCEKPIDASTRRQNTRFCNAACKNAVRRYERRLRDVTKGIRAGRVQVRTRGMRAVLEEALRAHDITNADLDVSAVQRYTGASRMACDRKMHRWAAKLRKAGMPAKLDNKVLVVDWNRVRAWLSLANSGAKTDAGQCEQQEGAA